MIVVAIISVLTALVMPNLNDLSNRSKGMKCSQNLRMIQMAKSNYAIEYAGRGKPDTGSADDMNAFKSYFPEGFDYVADRCPATDVLYDSDSVFNIYRDAECASNFQEGGDLATFPDEIPANAPNFHRNGYHDLGRRQ